MKVSLARGWGGAHGLVQPAAVEERGKAGHRACGHLVTCGGEIVGALRTTETSLPVDRPESLGDGPPYFFVARVHARDHDASAGEDAGDFPERRVHPPGRPWINPSSGPHHSNSGQRLWIATGARPVICGEFISRPNWSTSRRGDSGIRSRQTSIDGKKLEPGPGACQRTTSRQNAKSDEEPRDGQGGKDGNASRVLFAR